MVPDLCDFTSGMIPPVGGFNPSEGPLKICFDKFTLKNYALQVDFVKIQGERLKFFKKHSGVYYAST